MPARVASGVGWPSTTGCFSMLHQNAYRSGTSPACACVSRGAAVTPVIVGVSVTSPAVVFTRYENATVEDVVLRQRSTERKYLTEQLRAQTVQNAAAVARGSSVKIAAGRCALLTVAAAARRDRTSECTVVPSCHELHEVNVNRRSARAPAYGGLCRDGNRTARCRPARL